MNAIEELGVSFCERLMPSVVAATRGLDFDIGVESLTEQLKTQGNAKIAI
jgi:hypothetical protein